MLLTLQSEHHLLNEVIDIEKFQLYVGVVYLNGQAIGDVVAKSGHRSVIVRTAPLSEEVRETIHQDFSAGLAGVVEEKLFSGLLALAVRVAGIAAYKGSLNRA